MALATAGVRFIAQDLSKAGFASFQKQLGSVTRSLLAAAGAGGGLYALGSSLRDGVRQAIDFEKGISRVSTMLDEGSMSHLPAFRREIEKMSVQYGKSVNDLSAGLSHILGSAIAPAEAMKVLEANVRAARGGFTETSISVEAVVGILNAYGLQARRVSDITNWMAKVVYKGVITYEELAHNIGLVSSLAAVLGIDLEAVGAVIATMTRAGINADITMTSLRAILNTFSTPTDEAKKAARELGFALNENSIKGGGLITVMERLRQANAKQLDALMPNMRGLVGFAAGLQNATQLGEDYAYMMNDANLAEISFAKATADASTKIDIVTQKWNAAKRSFGELILPAVTESLNSFAWMLQNVDDQLQATIDILKSLHEVEAARKTVPLTIGGFGGFGAMGVAPPSPVTQIPTTITGESVKLGSIKARQMIAEYRAKQRSEKELQAMADRWIQEGFPSSTLSGPPTAITMEPSKRMQTLMQQVDQEIALLGRLSEPRQHARMMIEYQAEAAETYGANTRAAALATEAFAVQLKKLEGAETWAKLADTMANSMADGFERMTFEAQTFGDFMKQLGRDLLKEFMRLMIFRPMAQGIMGGLSSLFVPSARGNIFERGRIVPMAAGGVVSGPMVFPMAGEAGPEGFFPLTRIQGKLAIKGTSSAPSIVINNHSGVPIRQAGPPRFNDGQWVVGLVVEDFIRGGAIKNMVEGRGV